MHTIVRLIIKILEAKKLAMEYFEYREHHLFHQIQAVVYPTTAAVQFVLVELDWICFTCCIFKLILNTIDKDAPDHHKKEEYAFCFLILFVPFRSREDLEIDN
jgi:hypothetical protein